MCQQSYSSQQLLEPEDYDSIIAAHKAKGEKFWSDPKVKQLKKMGFSKYLISHLQDWYDDISDVPFDVLKKEMQDLKAIYAEIDEENDNDDQNGNCNYSDFLHCHTLTILYYQFAIPCIISFKASGKNGFVR